MQDLTPGHVVDSRYVVEAEIGRGGMSTVYRVRHAALQSLHALKVVRDTSVEAHARLLREGRAQAALHHPNVVRVTDVVRLGDSTGLILEHVDGPALDGALRDGRLSDWAARDAVARGILRGVKAAHAQGWVHRDLKPSNVLLAWADGGWIPKVADFGLARAIVDASLTRSGGVVGSPAYMAPEQLLGLEVDARADVFALGALLYELVTGRRAFDGNVYEVSDAIRAGRFPRPRERVPDVPARMERAILGALVVDPAARIRDCGTLLSVWSGEDERPSRGRATWAVAALAVTAALALYGATRPADPPAGSLTSVVPAPPAAIVQVPAPSADPPSALEAAVAPTSAAPHEPPPRPPTGVVEAVGAAIELVRAERTWPSGVVPTGRYEVRARFGDKLQSFGTIEVSAGATVRVVCDARFSRCRIEP